MTIAVTLTKVLGYLGMFRRSTFDYGDKCVYGYILKHIMKQMICKALSEAIGIDFIVDWPILEK